MPYTDPSLNSGVVLLYRRNKGNGTWVVKASDGHGAYWTKAFGLADDYDEADGERILTFYEAQDKAKELARGRLAPDPAFQTDAIEPPVPPAAEIGRLTAVRTLFESPGEYHS